MRQRLGEGRGGGGGCAPLVISRRRRATSVARGERSVGLECGVSFSPNGNRSGLF